MGIRFKLSMLPITPVTSVTANVTTIESVDATDALQAAAAAAITAAGIPAATVTAIGTGSGLSAVPWNPAWDADAQSECADAIAAAGLAPGTGARTCTITVNDGATALESARVRVTKGAESYVLNTNVSGQATFNLDDGSWVVAITLAGYTYSGTTLVVDGDETATYSMTAVTITPSAAGFVTGYWTCYGTNGAIEAGTTHYLQVVEGAGTAGLSIDGTKRTAVSGVDGVVQFAGIPHGGSVRVWRGTAKPMGPFVAPTSGTTWAMDEVVGTP
jgi:hypothetical protein